ncbi:hypothetical protein [Hymenobacter sp. CRA2]|nr:hypothetical protein [Hymenobacter sp. CRA2]
MLSIISPGTQVQVLDSSHAYFVRAQLSKDGKTLTGYMYRACLGGVR